MAEEAPVPERSRDLAGYALGALGPEEARAVEARLAGSEELRRELAGLRAVVDALAAAPPAPAPPPRLARRTLAAVRRDARGARAGARPTRTLGAALAALAAVAIGVGIVRAAGGGGDGAPELEARLRAADGAVSATAEVRATGIGRVVELRSDDLPVLPRGEFYEVWFVGPGDAPGRPRRISAGTFHPDADGRSDVRLTAAVDPALYGVISVTREPGDGDPAPGAEVLRSEA